MKESINIQESLFDEDYESFCRKIDDLARKGIEEGKRLAESKMVFKNKEEVLEYYHKKGYLTVVEWENQIMEKYGPEINLK